MRQKFLALLCALTLVVGAVSPTAAALEGESARAADTLATLNVLQDDYRLDEPATRAQAVVLLVRLAGAQRSAEADVWISGFRDVPAWAETAVSYAAHQGWVRGVTILDFKPDAPLSANAWFTFLLRMLGYSDKDGDFAVTDAALFAQRIGLTSHTYTGELSRGALFQSAAEALTFSYKDGSATVAERLAETDGRTAAAVRALGLLDETLTPRQAADRHMAAVFQLNMFETQQQIDDKTPSADATGFFISADGLAVTNYHSIEDAIRADATLVTGEVYTVERVIWYDPGMDLAVIRVSRTSTTHQTTSAFAYLELAGTAELRPGDDVCALGNPLGLGLAVSEGVVSAVGREVDRYDLPCVVNTAHISQGSSGGALLNTYGRVVAVTSGAYTYGNSMYLAVPVDPILTADLTAEGMTLAEVVKLEKAKRAE